MPGNSNSKSKSDTMNVSVTTKKNVVVIMGCTGSGKSRLSLDIARHFPSEIINSDKIQLYQGLDITTNKVPGEQRSDIQHHLLDLYDPTQFQGELSPAEYRDEASSAISLVHSRDKLPLLVGGSTSYIYALLAREYDPHTDVFSGDGPVTTELKYKCCLLWVDAAEEVLREYLEKRFDEMAGSGMAEELWEFYRSGKVNEVDPDTGLRRAIGVAEFEPYFSGRGTYEEFVREVKGNTWKLAQKQLAKIHLLRNAGWDIHRLDATHATKSILEGSHNWVHVWTNQVVHPTLKILNNFFQE